MLTNSLMFQWKADVSQEVKTSNNVPNLEDADDSRFILSGVECWPFSSVSHSGLFLSMSVLIWLLLIPEKLAFCKDTNERQKVQWTSSELTISLLSKLSDSLLMCNYLTNFLNTVFILSEMTSFMQTYLIQLVGHWYTR